MFKGLSILAATEAAGNVRRLARALPWFAAGAVIGLLGISALMQAAHGWLSQQMSPIEAHMVIAAVLLISGAIVAAAGAYVRTHRTRPDAMTTTALLAVPAAARFVSRRLPLGPVAIAGVVAAGALLGRFLGNRN